MKLVVLGPGHPFRGGIATTTTEMVRVLRGRGHEVVFMTPRRQYPEWLYPGAAGGRDPNACPRLEDSRPVVDPLNPLTWPDGRRAASRERADAWVIPYWTWVWAGWWRFLLGSPRPPAVAVVHNPVDHDAGPAQRAAARLVLGRCQGLFTHARALAAHLSEAFPAVSVASYPLPATSAVELPNRTDARRSLGLATEGRVAVFMGLIRPYKGVDVLLDAVAALPADSDWFVVVAGEPWGALGDQLRARAGEPDLVDRVRLELDWVNEDRMRILLAAADVVVLPYRSGSQSAIAPQVLGHGVPVLATAVGGLPEVVLDGVNGRLVAPGSVAELASALIELDETTLAELAAGARATTSRLTWDGYAAELEGLIESVIDTN
jgi:glycosyltransferase involved in cell wall biosynthesis